VGAGSPHPGLPPEGEGGNPKRARSERGDLLTGILPNGLSTLWGMAGLIADLSRAPSPTDSLPRWGRDGERASRRSRRQAARRASTSNAGKVLPSSTSRKAPPPVEM